MKRKLLLLLIPLVFIASLYYLLTKPTTYSVVINKPLTDVWKYASDSTKATDWSVYFHHISPLPGIEDGKVGSTRRCYRRANEMGPMWDEDVTEVIPLKYRQLKTYNLQNFKEPIVSKAEFRVHQYYEKIDENHTKLTFASELIGPWEFALIKALIPAAAETERIFKANLENIKAAIEQGDSYQRPHAYEETNPFDSV